MDNPVAWRLATRITGRYSVAVQKSASLPRRVRNADF